jgi:hypothetical protein
MNQRNAYASQSKAKTKSSAGLSVQPKLAINAPGDRYEQEADAMADRVMRSPDQPGSLRMGSGQSGSSIQRKCAACQEEEEKQPLMRKAIGSGGLEASPGLVSQLGNTKGAGTPLPAGTRNFMESAFSTDFSRVRIHADGQAAAMSRGIQAKAFTQGSDIYFNEGQYSPHTQEGQRLLAHELTHTVQQNNGLFNRHFQPLLTEPSDSQAQHTNDAGGKDGYPEAITSLHSTSIQRQEAGTEGEASTGSAGSFLDSMIERVSITAANNLRRSLPFPIPETVLAALMAAEAGFIMRSFQRLVTRGEMSAILSRGRELSNPEVFLAFNARFIWGVIKGLVSPITGLVQLGIAAVQFQNAAVRWMLELAPRIPGLIEEARALSTDLQNFSATAQQTLQTLRQRGQLMEFASGLLREASSAGGAFERYIVGAARRKGHEAADALVDGMLHTPLPDLAETAGEIIGVIVIELVMLIFTEGIGNLITKIGELARVLRPLSRGVVVAAEVLIRVGRAIAQVEHMIGVLLSRTVFRPLMPIFRELEPLLGRMRGFVTRLIGISEEGGVALARAGAGVVERRASSSARIAESTPPPLPEGVTPITASRGRRGPQLQQPSREPVTSLEEVRLRQQAPEARPTQPASAERPIELPQEQEIRMAVGQDVSPTRVDTDRPRAMAGGGSGGRTPTSQPRSSSGTGRTSTPSAVGPPAHTPSSTASDVTPIPTRTSQPTVADRFQSPAEPLSNPVRSRTPGSRRTIMPPEAVDEAIARLDTPGNPFELHIGERRASQIASGERNFALDHPAGFDIDEPLAVGAHGISKQRAVDRALDPHNRELLDAPTNRQSKHLRESPDVVTRHRERRTPVSLVDDPSAVFTRRFDEVTELRQVFDEAVQRVGNIRSLSPTAIKARVNANIRDIIRHGQTPAGIRVRDTLRSLGFEFVPGRGIVAVR